MTKKILSAILIIVTLFTLVSCNNKPGVQPSEQSSPVVSFVSTTDEQWPTEFVSVDILPVYENGILNYYRYYERTLRIYLYLADETSFMQYMEKLKSIGYSDISIQTKSAFTANLNDYHIVMNRDTDTNKVVIDFTTPLTWPQQGYITMLPVPDDIRMIQIIGESNSITLVISDMGTDKFNEYTEKVIQAGFTDILITSDTVFVAESENFITTLVRQPEKGTMDIGVYEKN